VDRFESEREQFFERVRAAYLDLALKHSHRIAVIDASASIDQVQAQAAGVLERLAASITAPVP
jgi:dTMP kinase